ncbi:MAG: YegS/Rv2252/BmrU family lipid kinase [Bacilli bacterium]|nr:YegS/Rv2252/BmrU family lipid kinase [Bacilli bacterium]
MKALFIYSSLTGHNSIKMHLSLIEQKLKEKFIEFKMLETKTKEELKDACLLACQEYDYLIFAGGDGTVNAVINNVADQEKKPILGYIPAGTTNDFAKNFHLSRRIRSALKNITKGVPAPFDIFKVNNKYVAYVLACGAFSEISYTAKRGPKKVVGPLAYYLLAMRDVFIPRRVIGKLSCNGKNYDVNTPFLLVLNGNHVGGFYLNFKNKINDGKFNIYITKPGVFNGLLHYLFFKMRTVKIQTDYFTFTFLSKPTPWCIDGELANIENVEVKCYPSHLKIITSKRMAKKLYSQQAVAVEQK